MLKIEKLDIFESCLIKLKAFEDTGEHTIN